MHNVMLINGCMLLESLIEYSKFNEAIDLKNQEFVMKGTLLIKTSPAGWDIFCQWNDLSQTQEVLLILMSVTQMRWQSVL